LTPTASGGAGRATHRIRVARRLLESGETIAQAALATGFADQSHLHRHFQRSLGITPATYQQRFNGRWRACRISVR
jgi:transcriptional regulator GlxA family with amidase domain